MVEQYRDLDVVFDRSLLPTYELPRKRRKEPAEFPENYSQECESYIIDPESAPGELFAEIAALVAAPNPVAGEVSSIPECGYTSYQLIRNVLAAYAEQCSFCVIHDERRPDLREQWFEIMAAVKSAELRTRLKVVTWQELAAFLPEDLQGFLDCKYGIVAPGRTPGLVPEEEPSE